MKGIKKASVIFLSCGLLLITLPCLSQAVDTDSLQRILHNTKADSLSIKAMLLSGQKMANKDYDAKRMIYQWGIQQSGKINYPAGMAMGYRLTGLLHRDLYNSSEATENMLKAIEVAEKNKLYKLQAQAMDGLAGIYRNGKAFNKAIEYVRAGISIYEKYSTDKTGLGSLYFNLGAYIHDSVGAPRKGNNNEEVLTYLRRGIKIAEEAKDSLVLLQLLNGTSSVYSEMNRFDTAMAYLDRTEALIRELKVPRFYSSYYLYKGNLYKSQKDFAKALEYYKTGLRVAVSNKDPYYERLYLGNLSKAYAEINDSVAAYKYFIEYDKVGDSINRDERLKLTALIDGQFQKERKEKEISRLQVEQRIRQLELEKQKAIIAGNLLEAKQKQSEIELLSAERELQDLQLGQQEQLLSRNRLQAKADSQQIQLGKQESLLQEKRIGEQKRTRNLLIAGLSLLAFLSFVLYRNIAARKKAYTQLQDKSQQIKDQALQLSKQAKQIAQFQSQMNPHFVYNALHNIQGLVLIDEKQKANSQIQSLAQLMRKTFANADKDDIPLDEEITYLNKYIEFEKNAFGNDLDFEVRVTKDAEGALIPPMMIQPFIENAIKHAELKKVANPYIKVLIETENNLLAINIMDNGTGIKKELETPEKLSHSLSVIKSRLDLLFKGKADVNSQPVFSVKTVPEINEGTRIKFYLPLNYSY